MSVVKNVFRALVEGYNGIQLSNGESLQSSTTKNEATPSLLWKVAGWKSNMWQAPYQYQVQWDIPCELRVATEAANPDALIDALDDLDTWSSFIYGLPVDEAGNVVPYGGKVYDRLSKLDKIFSIATRFVGPYIQRVTVRPTEADNALAIADVLFHVEFVADATPKANAKAMVFVVGANILYPNHTNNPQAENAPYSYPAPATADTFAQGAFAKPDTTLTIQGVETHAGFPPIVQDLPSVDGTGDPVKEITIYPATFTVSAGTPTKQLTAIAFHDSGATEVPAFTWASTNQAVATVEANGLVTRVSAGTTTITASYGGASGSSAGTSS